MLVPEYFEHRQPTRLIFGAGALSRSGDALGQLGARRPLILSAPSALRNGFTARLIESVEKSGLQPGPVFDEIPPDSGVEIVAAAARLGRESGCDSIAAIGGGSVLDTAKAAAVVMTHGGDVADDWQGAYIVPGPLIPLLAAPTTAGAGTETTIMAMIRHGRERMKISLLSPFLAPGAAILDPLTTVPLPPELTASTGIDALAHALEALISNQAQPLADSAALEALTVIMDQLPRVMADPEDIEARSRMLIASALAGIAASNAFVGVVHALAHAVGGLTGAPHAQVCGALLPHGLDFNMEFSAPRLEAAADRVGLAAGSGPAAAEALIEQVRSLLAELPVPQRLSEFGFDRALIPELAELAMGDGTALTNPRPVEDPALLEDLLNSAW